MTIGDTVVTFADTATKKAVLRWQVAREQTAEECIATHFTGLYGVPEVAVAKAVEDGDHLLLHASSTQWEHSREVALTHEGSLIW